MTRGMLGAVLGLIAGWIVATMLQRAVGSVGANGLVILLLAIVGAVMGANLGGGSGALAGAVVGGIMGVLAVQLLFLVFKLAAAAFGAALGWQLTSGSS